MPRLADWRKKHPIGGRLKELRQAAGLTQLDLVLRTGIGLSVLAGMEQDWDVDIYTSTVFALADGLGVAPGELLREPAIPRPAKRDRRRKK